MNVQVVVEKIEMIKKGALYAKMDVVIPELSMRFRDCKIFTKGISRWVSMPSAKWEKNGEVKFIPLVTFESEDKKNIFSKMILDSFDATEKHNEAVPF